jgi:hypothetical protein
MTMKEKAIPRVLTYGDLGGQAKILLREQRKNHAFHADHASDEGVDENQQTTLPDVFAQAKVNDWLCGGLFA